MDQKSNPFDLTAAARQDRGGGPDRVQHARTWTEEEQLERLQGYMLIPREFWPNIKYGTHVRYIKKTGEYRPGGFILKNPFDTKPRGGSEEKRFMKFQNNFNSKTRGHVEWIEAYEDLEHVYAKMDAVALAMHQNMENAVTALNTNIRKLAKHAKELEAKLKKEGVLS